MGVPVVTMRGSTHSGRMGASLLTAAGIPEWIAADEREYLEIASAAAASPQALDDLRLTLRERLRRSKLFDEAGFTLALEAEYRRVWCEWCRDTTATTLPRPQQDD